MLFFLEISPFVLLFSLLLLSNFESLLFFGDFSFLFFSELLFKLFLYSIYVNSKFVFFGNNKT